MLLLRIVALLLIAAGAWALAFGEIRYTKDSKDLKIGPIELAMRQQETIAIPQWAGFGAIGVGVVLLLVRGRKR
jgi:hypothetical protein